MIVLSKIPNAVSRIVIRLRLAFLSVTLLILGATILGVSQFRDLSAAVDTLVSGSIPLLVRAEDNQRGLNTLLLKLQETETAASVEAVQGLSIELDTLQTAMRYGNEMGAQDGPAEARVNTFRQALIDVETSSNRMVKSRSDILKLEQALKSKISDLRVKTTQVASDLEYWIFLTSQEREDYLSSGTPRVETIQSYFVTLENETYLTTLLREISGLLDTSTNLANSRVSDDVERYASTLSFEFRGIAGLVARLPSGPNRTEIAKMVLDIRKTVLGPSGVLDLTRALVNLAEASHILKTAQVAPIARLSELSTNLNQSALQQISNAKSNLSQASRRAEVILAGTALLSILAIASAILFIVERQINHRMSELTDAVTEIAGGQIDRDVPIHGNDEIAEIADALEVFKVNARQLKQSNEDLEKFAYAAAHDLRSPLRAIHDLTTWTMEDDETVFSQESHQNLLMIQSRTKRLNMLLVDLLKYAMIGKDDEAAVEVSLKQIMVDVFEILEPSGRFTLDYLGPEDVVTISPTPLRQILLNLVTNAIKHHDRDAGKITVFATRIHDRLRITLMDDGPGIEPRYHQKIFELFQTLRSRDDVEGSGLGLAMIAKLVSRQNGGIQVDSDPAIGRGAAFTFDVPELSPTENSETKAA